MNEDKVVNVSVISLTLKNFHIWIKEIKIITKNAEIWKFVDSENTAEISKKDSSSNVSDYQISIQADDGTRSITALRELSDKQRKEHKLNLLNHQYHEKYIDRINTGIMRVQNVIKLFARMYLSLNELSAESRRMLKTLSDRYKLSDARVKEQLHETWRALKTSSFKVKIEQWIADWENLKQEMIDLNLAETFENDVIFVSEFLTAERKWALNFCDNWENQHKTADKDIEFFKTTRIYREVIQKESSMFSSRTVNVATLQEQSQNEKKKNNKTDDKKNVKKKGRKCLCLKMHLFKECFYICKSTRSSDWKEDKKIRNEMRQRLKTIGAYKAIKRVSNTNFLNEITEEIVRKRQQEFFDDSQSNQNQKRQKNRQKDEEEFRF